MEHTKGPWEFRVASNGDCGIHAPDTGVFAEAFADIRLANENARNEAKANARLIAAAPELLEFVQQILNGIDTGNITIDTPADETLANILLRGRKALSKATGAA